MDNILTRLRCDTALQLKTLSAAGLDPQQARMAFIRTTDWHQCTSHQTGYFGSIDQKVLLSLCKQYEVKIEVHPFRGQFVLANTLLFDYSRPLTDEALTAFRACFYFSRDEREALSDNHLAGFQQLAEIGVRAMSPGINDPMTAVSTLEVLSELFAQRVQCSTDLYWGDAADGQANVPPQVWVCMKGLSHVELLYQVMVSYRTYCKADVSCLQSMLQLLNDLYHQPALTKADRHGVMAEAARVLADARLGLQNPYDLMRIEARYQHLPQSNHVDHHSHQERNR